MEDTFLMKVTQKLKSCFKKHVDTEHMEMQLKHMDVHMLKHCLQET